MIGIFVWDFRGRIVAAVAAGVVAVVVEWTGYVRVCMYVCMYGVM